MRTRYEHPEINVDKLYHIDIDFKTKEHKTPEDSEGNKIDRLKFLKEYQSYSAMEIDFKNMAYDLSIVCPNFDVYISAYVYNGISMTYMHMASYYGPEKRFIQH